MTLPGSCRRSRGVGGTFLAGFAPGVLPESLPMASRSAWGPSQGFSDRCAAHPKRSPYR
jgi:hypothetical protein